MRLVIILFILLAMGCVSKVSFLERRPLEYNQIRNLNIGLTVLSDVEKIFGKPAERSVSEGFYTIRYNDPATGYQRLSLNFSDGNDILTGILWAPFENEPEYQLNEAKMSFKDAIFKEFKENENNPHTNSDGALLLIDDSRGITIRYNQTEKMVEAIAIYSLKLRLPAGAIGPKKVPYTLGEKY